MSKVVVEKVHEEPWEFRVTTGGEDADAQHTVTMNEDEYERYGGDLEPVELIQATFAFLLDRETAEDIAEHFSLSEVEKNFPEYPDAVEDYSK